MSSKRYPEESKIEAVKQVSEPVRVWPGATAGQDEAFSDEGLFLLLTGKSSTRLSPPITAMNRAIQR